MKFSQALIASAVLLATSSVALAATSTSSVEIQVTQSEFANLIGTAIAAPHTFTSADMVVGTSHSLGSLGIDSNLAGSCNMVFSSANGYKLNLGGTLAGATLVDYALSFDGTPIVANTVNSLCALPEAPLSFAATTALPAANTIAAGTYSDVVTIVVTSI